MQLARCVHECTVCYNCRMSAYYVASLLRDSKKSKSKKKMYIKEHSTGLLTASGVVPPSVANHWSGGRQCSSCTFNRPSWSIHYLRMGWLQVVASALPPGVLALLAPLVLYIFSMWRRRMIIPKTERWRWRPSTPLHTGRNPTAI